MRVTVEVCFCTLKSENLLIWCSLYIKTLLYPYSVCSTICVCTTCCFWCLSHLHKPN